MKESIPENVMAILSNGAKIIGTLEEEIFKQRIYSEILEKEINSPIEQILYTALSVVAKANFIELSPDPYYNFLGKEELQKGPYLFCQHKIGNYRVDFAFLVYEKSFELSSKTEPNLKWVIECDGHDFHEKTKEQATSDKKRDRYLTANGWKILRFSGSEIYKDAYGVAVEILKMVVGDWAEHPNA